MAGADVGKKGNLKIDLRLHARFKAAAALSVPAEGINEFAEKHLWRAVGGKPRLGVPVAASHLALLAAAAPEPITDEEVAAAREASK